MATTDLTQLTNWEQMRRRNPLPWLNGDPTGQPIQPGQLPQAPYANLWQSGNAQGANALDWTKTAQQGASNQSLTGGPPPTSPTGLTSGNPNQNGVGQRTLTPGVVPKIAGTNMPGFATTGGAASNATSDQWEQWLNESGNLGGQTWDGKQWTGGGPVAAGSNVMGASGMKTTTGYDARKDTNLYEFNGVANSESNWHRVNRWAMDNARDRGMDPQAAYNAALARLKYEAQAAGRDLNTLGFDLTNVQAAPQGAAGAGQAPQTGQSPQTGGTPVADPNGGGGAVPPVPGAGGVSNPQYNLFLQKDKAARMAALLDRLGLGDPMRQRSVFGSAVGGTLGQVLDPWMQTQGMAGGNVTDNFSNLIDKFVGNFKGGGGGMGAIAGDAANAARIASTDPRYTSLEDPEMIALLQGFSQLANLPQNEWLQRAYGNMQDDSVSNFYGQVNKAAQNGGDPASIRYLQTIKSNPLFGFLTGQGR